jgi:hypothetical protein
MGSANFESPDEPERLLEPGLHPKVAQIRGYFEERVNPYIKQLLIVDGVPTLLGTGLLVEANGAYYVITAAHVLEHQHRIAYFHDNSAEWISMRGAIVTDGKVEGRYINDTAVCRLAGPWVPPFKDWKALPIQALKSLNWAPFGHYAISGYAKSKFKRNPKRNIIKDNPEWLSGLTLVHEDEKRVKRLSGAHIHLHLDRHGVQRFDGQKYTFADLHGFSGSPIWHEDQNGFGVVAIAIEYHENKKVLIATHIQLVLDQIKLVERAYQEKIRDNPHFWDL